jgi:hypothetical protein
MIGDVRNTLECPGRDRGPRSQEQDPCNLYPERQSRSEQRNTGCQPFIRSGAR